MPALMEKSAQATADIGYKNIKKFLTKFSRKYNCGNMQ